MKTAIIIIMGFTILSCTRAKYNAAYHMSDQEKAEFNFESEEAKKRIEQNLKERQDKEKEAEKKRIEDHKNEVKLTSSKTGKHKKPLNGFKFY
jgi:hypothetical protein